MTKKAADRVPGNEREENTNIARKTLHQRPFEGKAMYIPRVRSYDGGADKCVAIQGHIAKTLTACHWFPMTQRLWRL